MAAAIFRELAGVRSRRVVDGADEYDPDEPALRWVLVPKVRALREELGSPPGARRKGPAGR